MHADGESRSAAGAALDQAERATDEIELRALKSHADLNAGVELQRLTWGADYTDCVPASILKVSQLVGGVSAGAFAADGRLVGFVYGLTGVREGRLVHWSHMLAVLPEYRNHGVGRRLKEFQRDSLRGTGVEKIEWTFDPLVARNAHLNLNRLGATVDAYVPDMYGDTGSALHAFGTDRFIVSWPVAGATPVSALAQLPDSWRRAPILDGGEPDGAVARIEIPRDVESMNVADARVWRAETRGAFVRALGAGYRVVAFVPGSPTCSYILARTQP